MRQVSLMGLEEHHVGEGPNSGLLEEGPRRSSESEDRWTIDPITIVPRKQFPGSGWQTRIQQGGCLRRFLALETSKEWSWFGGSKPGEKYRVGRWPSTSRPQTLVGRTSVWTFS